MALNFSRGTGARARQSSGGGLGRSGGAASGPGGSCVCPKCKEVIPHQVGVPCYQLRCEKCNAAMERK